MNDLVHWLARCVCRGEDAGFSELVGGSTLLCPRCSGVYAGLLAGLAISLAVRRRSAGLPLTRDRAKSARCPERCPERCPSRWRRCEFPLPPSATCC